MSMDCHHYQPVSQNAGIDFFDVYLQEKNPSYDFEQFIILECYSFQDHNSAGF